MKDRKKILAISSSRVGNSAYLEKAMPMIKDFLGGQPIKIAFIPFAYVGDDPSPLVNLVRDAFNGSSYTIETVTAENGSTLIEDAGAIMVSGGNTFKLLHDLYDANLLNIVKGKVKAGTPYIGWSAGSNITGKTICTTNDMPIIEPKSFKALHFFPFQINPHYYNVTIEGFNGETRDDRLREFVQMNPGMSVVCLPEGTALKLENGVLKLTGEVPGFLMTNEAGDMHKVEIRPNIDITRLMQD